MTGNVPIGFNCPPQSIQVKLQSTYEEIQTAAVGAEELGVPTAVYIDGSRKDTSYATYWGHNDPRNHEEPLLGPEQTPQRVELRALVHVLQRATSKVSVVTDCKYLLRANAPFQIPSFRHHKEMWALSLIHI